MSYLPRIVFISLLALFMVSCEDESNVVSLESNVLKEKYVIKIETAKDISWDSKQVCKVEYIENGNSKFIGARLKCRGGASSKYPKHSYSIEFDTALLLCGITTDDDWILNASYIDKTFQRHKLSYDLFRKMHAYNEAAKCAYASVYINGKYEGLYVVMEEINGSMLKLNNGDDHAMLFKDPPIFYEERLDWVQDSNNYYQQKYPKIGTTDHAEALDRFNEILFNSEDFVFDGVVPYWISIKNIIDWHLLLLLTNNDDGLYKNFYLYKRGKINPFNIAIWDYDHSFGRDGDGELNMLERNVDPEKIILIKRLMESKEIGYKERLTARWTELRESGTFTVENLYSMIDANDKEIQPYLKSNFERWPLKSKWYQDGNTYDQEIQIMKEYVKKRIPQLDDYFNTL